MTPTSGARTLEAWRAPAIWFAGLAGLLFATTVGEGARPSALGCVALSALVAASAPRCTDMSRAADRPITVATP